MQRPAWEATTTTWTIRRTKERYAALSMRTEDEEQRGPDAAVVSLETNEEDEENSPTACCFCWCWCCSCRCMTIGPSDNSGISALMQNAPTEEELRSWSRNFDTMMRSSKGLQAFRGFLCSEYSEENLMFWLACEELHTISEAVKVEERARLMYEDYISILSPKEVSLDSRVREIVNRNMVDPTVYTFDEAQQQIYTLMQRDSFPRFINSKLFKTLLLKSQEASS
ncbi:regulator of G-protein signaling 17-like isoform X3 [Anneissia japonica]|uniref:regulator of G-protein signaling 17-like isoform X3 n=1 Tax=Anneissia japonica TaxID=1529436 RepID=UPI00142593BB|nr:regulator of G-protein signaling 17-like isoform X3 [Anneissia japonica]